MGGFISDRFFKINGIGDNENVGLVPLHLEGWALEWFHGYEASDKEINWQQFSIDVVSRFDPNAYDSPIGQITKLKHIATTRAYQELFEALMAKTSGLSKKFFVQCFISGLEEAKKK